MALAVVTTLIVFLVNFLELFKDPTYDYERQVAKVDEELWDLLGEPPTSPPVHFTIFVN